MRGRRESVFVCAVLATVLLASAAPAASLSPVEPLEGVTLQHVALHALESTLREGNLYAETIQETRFFTKDQMMGVLAALEGRWARPDRTAFWEERARTLW